LVAAAFNVAVCDAVPGRAEKFAAEIGGTATPDAACAAADADAVITILPTSKHFADVIEQIRPQLKRGGLVIEMSSGIPSITKRLAAELAGDGVAMIDAPVSGGVSRAKAGELAIMTGGEAAALQRAAPLLKAMGTTVTEVGSIGAGQAMKALNNLVSAGGFLIGVEALLIGQAFGLVPEKMVDVLNASTGMNNSTQKKYRQFVLSRAFNSNFGLDLMAKDLGIALEVGRDGGVATPFAALCKELWLAASASLGQGKDHTEMARFSEQLAGRILESAAGD
jgi:3-hydroxyisobutyrate dehydrogenase